MTNSGNTPSTANLIKQLLDRIDAVSAGRPDFDPVMPRDTAEKAMHALLRLYGSGSDSAAGVYAAVALADALRDYPIVTGNRPL